MKKIEITEFDIKPDKLNVLRAVGCTEGSGVYDTAARYFDEISDKSLSLIKPYGAAVIDDMRACCLLSIGNDISDFSKRLFDDGEAIKGLLSDAIADEFLFGADKILTDALKKEGAVSGFGVKKRLEAPRDFPLSEQEVILARVNTDRVSVTDAFMLCPVKSMAYILELTDDKNIFNAQHDCSKCTCADCPRRSAPFNGEFEIITEYDFTPSLTKNESAVCIDIGTTTIAFELITDKGTVCSHKTINPQRRFGLDVLSRIEAANRGRENELSSAVRYALIQGYKEVTRGHGAPDRVVIAGNTAMVYLLMNYPCEPLGKYPFKAEHLDTVKTGFAKLTSSAGDDVPAVVYGGISAFVGGDIVSGLCMCGFDTSEKINLFIDLGTNGEMAIGNKNGTIATSTAAGPAFEGGRISCGTGSVDGAVCSVTLKPFALKTINGKPPAGICGTGIIELASEMKDNKIIDNTGLLAESYFDRGYPLTEKILFTQNDIRQLQMAKAAVRAGIECLIREYGADYDDIDTVFLAGGFGYALSPEKACNIGILPQELKAKTKAVGNSSLGGCAKYCSDVDGDERIEYIKKISRDFPLGNNTDFEKLYLEYMNF